MLSSIDDYRNFDLDATADVDRERLLDLLGLYGLAVCLRLVDDGADNATELLRGLRVASGIDALTALIDGDFSGRADLWRAWRAVEDLERLSYLMGPEDRSVAERLRDDLEQIRLRPDVHPVSEMRVLRDLDAGTIRLPPELEAGLLTLARNTSPSARLGLPGDATAETLRRVGRERWQAWRELENDARATSATRSAARVVRESFEMLLTDLDPRPDISGTSAPVPTSNGVPATGTTFDSTAKPPAAGIEAGD